MPGHLMKEIETIWQYHQMAHTPQVADCIFVMCSNDIRVADRAVELYRQGKAPYILVSGGKGRFTDALFDSSEARAFADVMVDAGVPEEVIFLEEESTNSGENVRFSWALTQHLDLSLSSFILVQKPFMERRAYATFLKQWPGEVSSAFVTSPQIPFIDYPNEDMPFDMVVGAMLADLKRIKEYPAKGFQIEQTIPDDVWNAYCELERAGLKPESE